MKKGMIVMLALTMVGTAFLAIPANVSAQAEVPTWDIGDGWYFGNTADFDEMQQKIDQGLGDLPPGFDASVDVGGGVGAYFGVEVVDDDVMVNGYECYQVDLTGALAIDFGMDASVDGTINEDMYSIDVDASGNAVIVAEANLDGSLYFTVDQLAFVKGDVTVTADGNAEIHADAFVAMEMDLGEYGGQNYNEQYDIHADILVEIDAVSFSGSIECDPPIDFFDFPIYEGDSWLVPEPGTEITTTWSAQGTVDMQADVTGIPDEPAVHEHETVNLATEIGSGSETTTVWNTVMFSCVAVYGNNYIIETGTGNFINYFDFGTRQYGIDYMDMLPVDEVMPENAGVQYNADSGFVNGMTMDGEVMTSTTDKAAVDSFSADPLGNVAGHGDVGEGGGALGALLVVGIIIIVVVFVVVLVVVSRRKKKGPEQMYGAQQPYQQPPPPQYPPQQQAPPPPPPQYQPPPPPPPPPGQ